MTLYGIDVYNDYTLFYILDPDMFSKSGKVTVCAEGNPTQVSSNFYYITSYKNHEYHWDDTLY